MFKSILQSMISFPFVSAVHNRGYKRTVNRLKHNGLRGWRTLVNDVRNGKFKNDFILYYVRI